MSRTITINVTVDPSLSLLDVQIARAIEMVVGQVIQDIANLNYTDILGDLIPELERMHAGYFSGQHDPSGTGWPTLSPTTIKLKGSAEILVEKGTLKGSLTARGAGAIRSVAGRQLLFGTSVRYAGYHMTGFKNARTGTRVPPRPMVGLSSDGVDKITNQVADGIVKRLQ